MTQQQEGYGVCRSIDDAKQIAATAQRDNLRGCYPAAAVVLAAALTQRENEIAELKALSVRNIMIDVVPGDGSGLEIYAESVDDVVNQLTKLGEVAENYESDLILFRNEIAELERLSQRKQFDYIGEAMVTLSDSWHGSEVSAELFRHVVEEVVKNLKYLDAIKKALFYGRALPEQLVTLSKHLDPIGVSMESLPQWFKDDIFGEHVIHGIIGVATEAGELLEALQVVTKKGEEFDEVNLKEEVGDAFWYCAILADACGFTFEDSQRINIAKLRERYAGKFREFDAINRNVAEERKILEGA